MKKVAILVDGGFYRVRAAYLWGKKSPEERVNELISYTRRHLKDRGSYIINKSGKKEYGKNELYRIFYYDCPVISKVVYHPLLKKNIDLAKSLTYQWATEFIELLTCKRKVTLRLGKLADKTAHYNLNFEITKRLLDKKITFEELEEKDFSLVVRQKGVDMKIGIDIASLAYKKQVEQIVLISGDSDFVPAAKLARREGIDFVLDPMGQKINDDLQEHIDGLISYININIMKKNC